MKMRYEAELLRVFTDKEGNFGDIASVVIDEDKQLSDEERQSITKKLNTGETIFINNIPNTDISVIHSQGEIDFAGVGVLGAGWFFTKLLKKPIAVIHGRSGQITFWQEGEINWTQAK